MVNHIAERYCEKFGDTFFLKNDIVLITNIDGLQLQVERLEDYISDGREKPQEAPQAQQVNNGPKCSKCGAAMNLKNGKFGSFYSCSNFPQCKQTAKADPAGGSGSGAPQGAAPQPQNLGIHRIFSEKGMQALRDKYPDKRIIIAVDECQRYFHRRFYDREAFFAFEYHGHFGIDIYLISHNSSKLAPDIVNLLEYEIRAVPRSYSIGGFNYLEKQGYEVFGRKFLRKKKKIFNLYRSQFAAESEKIKRPMTKWFVGVGCMAVLAVYMVLNLFDRLSPTTPARAATVNQKANTQAAAPRRVPMATRAPGQIRTQEKVKTDISQFTELSYTKVGNEIFIIMNGGMIPLNQFPYDLRTFKVGHHTRIYGLIPVPDPEEEETRPKKSLFDFGNKSTQETNQITLGNQPQGGSHGT
jgi:ssDNA-binding Zn-finger/Zn-ribbon topoisomerase 1